MIDREPVVTHAREADVLRFAPDIGAEHDAVAAGVISAAHNLLAVRIGPAIIADEQVGISQRALSHLKQLEVRGSELVITRHRRAAGKRRGLDEEAQRDMERRSAAGNELIAAWLAGGRVPVAAGQGTRGNVRQDQVARELAAHAGPGARRCGRLRGNAYPSGANRALLLRWRIPGLTQRQSRRQNASRLPVTSNK